jgi:DNA-binding CsgD family transcriptional regulator
MTIRVLSLVEMRVGRLVAAGHSDDEVAQALGVTRDNVVRHLSRICRKLGARSRPELIAMWAEAADARQVNGPAEPPP